MWRWATAPRSISCTRQFASKWRAGNPPLLPVHWSTFALAMHDWDQPVERLLELAPNAGAQLVMPRLGEAIEPAHAETVTPWWRGAGSPLPAASRSDADSALPPQVPWPVD